MRQTYQEHQPAPEGAAFPLESRDRQADRAVHDHEDMIKALEARDGKLLGSILATHLLEKRDAIMRIHPDPVGDPPTANA
ncbi:hypothetical protein ACU4GD_21205 [Cupriavidus basilensis]